MREVAFFGRLEDAEISQKHRFVTAKRKYPLWGKISHPLTISPFLPIFSDTIPSYISQIRISREGF